MREIFSDEQLKEMAERDAANEPLMDVLTEPEPEAEIPVEEETETFDERLFRVLRAGQARNRKRLILLLSVLGALIIVAILNYYFRYLNGWHDSSDGRFYISDRQRLTGLYKIENAMYLFDGNGILLEGPAEEDGRVYYSTKDGVVRGVVEIDGEAYYFDEKDGVLRRGFYTEDGVDYYRNSHGFIETGIREIDGKVYYIGSDGQLLSGWAPFENGMRYFAPSDYAMVTGIREIDGAKYWFDWNGYVQKGFIRDDGICYYGESQNGALQFGRVNIDGKEYYLAEEGARLNGIAAAEGKNWYFIENAFQTGWVEDESGRFYCSADGLVTGNKTIDGKDYYFEPDYRLARGWITREDGRFYFDEDGAMLKGWQTIDGKNYCFSDKGVLYIGEFTLEGVKYLFAEDGAYYDGFTETEIGRQYYEKGYLKTGITQIEGKYYYLNDKGIPTGGMQTINGVPARYNEDGSAVTGWVTIDNKKYYFGENGVMMQGNVSIGGKRYYLSKDGGFLEQGWHTDGNGKMYCYENGTIAVGAVKIGGVLTAFSDTGYLITKVGLQKVGGKTRYILNDSGKIAVSQELKIGDKVYVADANGVCAQKFSTITDANLDEYLQNIINTKGKDIKTLYNWVKSTIPTYSYWSSGSKSIRTLACEAINKRYGACWHYAALMTLVLQKAGYEAKYIKGGGHTYSEHNWTAVKVNGQWLYIDAMRANVYLKTQSELDAMQFEYDPGHGPKPNSTIKYWAAYYYGYTKP